MILLKRNVRDFDDLHGANGSGFMCFLPSSSKSVKNMRPNIYIHVYIYTYAKFRYLWLIRPARLRENEADIRIYIYIYIYM